MTRGNEPGPRELLSDAEDRILGPVVERSDLALYDETILRDMSRDVVGVDSSLDTVEFQPWPKIARLNRDIVVTEKLDGTNAAIGITDDWRLYAQSRTRLISPENDNFGFAKWVFENHFDLLKLGPGIHFGEWWGSGIQRGYGLTKGEKRFSLFNTARWAEGGKDAHMKPDCCGVVPILYQGRNNTNATDFWLDALRSEGSFAAPGFMNPEGIVVYHTAARIMFKATLDKDEMSKGEAEALAKKDA